MIKEIILQNSNSWDLEGIVSNGIILAESRLRSSIPHVFAFCREVECRISTCYSAHTIHAHVFTRWRKSREWRGEGVPVVLLTGKCSLCEC